MAGEFIGFNRAGAIKIKTVCDRVLGQGRGEQHRHRRDRHVGPATGAAAGGGILIVLIDDDIEGVEEEEDAVIEGEGVDGADVSLYAYARRELELKYFRVATSDDPGYDADKQQLVLATERVLDDPDETDGPTHLGYSTATVLYDDGRGFKVDEYVRSDFPDIGDDDPLPPDGAPDDFLKRKFRGICVKDEAGNWVLVTILCKPLPAPAYPTGD